MPHALALLCTGLAALLLSVLTPAAQAGTLEVTVTGADGRPVADAVVLLRRPGAFQAIDAREQPVIEQKDIRFSPYVTVVPARASVRFVNRDRFDHHVRSMPGGPLGSQAPATSFEFRLAGARGASTPSAEVSFDTPGGIVIGCHLHGSMRAHIYVSATPWFAVTDARGRATLDVPEGPAELQLWHPDQLAEQAPRALTVPATGRTAVQQALNFSPAPRRAPPAVRDEYRY